MRWCQRQAECRWCHQAVEAGTAMVAVFFWNRGATGQKWNTQQCFHPQCWVEQGLDYLRKNPFVPVQKGRRRSSLTNEERRERFLITRRYHALVQRKGQLSDNIEHILVGFRLEEQMSELMLEMQRLGGVPKKWLERL